MPILAAAELLTGLKVFLHDHSDMPEQPLAISHTNMEIGPDGCLGQAGEWYGTRDCAIATGTGYLEPDCSVFQAN